jgi:hypothetical protein
MRVFYSWQSDTPNKVGRSFIREALDAAVSGLQLDEADRPVVDQDTAGVLGSPVIADTIFRKIRSAKVVVADVTLTGQTAAGKRLINSNVAIELGFAVGVHGDEVLLKVMNTHYGLPGELPFDLAHRRWPVQFKLSPEASSAERKEQRDALANKLGKILEDYIAASRPPPESFSPTPSTFNSAAYWQKGEALVDKAQSAERGPDGEGLIYNNDQPLVYLRIWPCEKIAPLSIVILGDHSKSVIEPLGGRTSGWSWSRNRYGLITYATYSSERRLAATTQVFKSGEIWGINERLLRKREDLPDLVPTMAYEEGLRESLRKYLHAARSHFGYPRKIMVESGFVNAKDYRLAMSQDYLERFWGPIFDDVKVLTMVDADVQGSDTAALLEIFEALFEAAGLARPKNLHNFPPGT